MIKFLINFDRRFSIDIYRSKIRDFRFRETTLRCFAGRKCAKVHFRYLEGIICSFYYFLKKWQCFCFAEKFCRIFWRQKREFSRENSLILEENFFNFWGFSSKNGSKNGAIFGGGFQFLGNWPNPGGFGQNGADFGYLEGRIWAILGSFWRGPNWGNLAHFWAKDDTF